MRQAHDTEAFAFAKSAVTARRSYFDRGWLLHQLPNQGRVKSSSTSDLRQEQQRIIAGFRAVLRRR